jgi:alpha-tubulin suppressor-like RCC1 family protein
LSPVRWWFVAALSLSACGARSALEQELGANASPASNGEAGGTAAGAHGTKLIATAIAVGDYRSCALMEDGSVRCWGQLGDVASLGLNKTPTLVPGVSGATSITASLDHGCATVQGGSLRCWGQNDFGQLGDGSQTAFMSSPQPAVTVAQITTAISVAAGIRFNCAVLADGATLCWGDDGFGQFGSAALPTNPNTQSTPFPTAVSRITQGVAVAVDYDLECVLLANGGVMCWGENNSGQVGNGSATPRNSIPYPVPVYGISDAVSVSVGVVSACALSADGSVHCWGENHFGQLGDGTTSDSAKPVKVNGLPEAIAIAAGNSSSCALIKGGTVQCWGNNAFGSLGDGTTTNSSVPVTVTGIANAIAISVRDHACALLSTGSVQCWGYNNSAQLGNGATTNSSRPVTVSGF